MNWVRLLRKVSLTIDFFSKSCFSAPLHNSPPHIIEIAYDYCPINVAYDYSNPNYPSSCRNVAYGACRGAIYDNVIDNGCSISTKKLNNLQNKCEDQVDSMIDYEVLKQD